MKRDTHRLASGTFDLVVIGAGIHGACVARDAALRGLRVAVVERGDLGGETSHNSLKTIHGGIRYIQHLNLTRTRESIREQTIWLKTAPHLVRPLPFAMPTYGHGMRGPAAMFAGLLIYRLLGWGRNAGLGPDVRIRHGRVMGAAAAREMLPDMPGAGLSGAALWDDAQVRFADRAVIEILSDAATHGAIIANYCEATRIVQDGARATGIAVYDRLGNQDLEIAGRVIVNAAGPWVGDLAVDLPETAAKVPLTRSMNIVSRRPARDFALSIKSDRSSDSKLGQTKRLYFEIPWQGCAIFGTTHAPASDTADTPEVQEAEMSVFIDELNAAWPGLDLRLEDVVYCYRGLTPAEASQGTQSRSHESRILDHATGGGLEALISLIGVKWTTGRLVAERAVDLAMEKLDRTDPCLTRDAPLPSLDDISFELAGKSADEIAGICATHIDRTQARTLRDMLLRRTDDLVRGCLGAAEIGAAAKAMQARLGWDAAACAEQADMMRAHWLPAETEHMIKTSDLFEGTT